VQSAVRTPSLVAVVTSTAVVVLVPGVEPAGAAGTPVMGRSVVSAADLAGWYRSTDKTNRATEGIDALARYFIEEGAAEGVAGDIAFAQAIVETGYFGFSERVKPEFNNFSGLGAVDNGTTAEVFPDARTGVRAQIQHLRAYADPTVTISNLAHPLVDTRFHLVSPKGRATDWEEFGGGVWATDPDYAGKVLRIRLSILQWGRRYGTARFAPFSSADPYVQQGFRDVLFREGTSGEVLLWSTALRQNTVTPETFLAELFRGEGADTVQQVTRLYLAALGRLPDRSGLAYWTNRRKGGDPLSRLAAQVIGSREFEVRFGSHDAEGFVELLYQNVLGRSPDAKGGAYWAQALSTGGWTPTGVLLHFSESVENKGRTAARVELSVLQLGLWETRPTSADVTSWAARRSSGERLEDLVFTLVVSTDYLGRF
jgi:hypothetical protein